MTSRHAARPSENEQKEAMDAKDWWTVGSSEIRESQVRDEMSDHISSPHVRMTSQQQVGCDRSAFFADFAAFCFDFLTHSRR